MTLKNPIGKIKDVAAASLRVPVTVAGTAVDLAKGAVGTVGAVIGSDKAQEAQEAQEAAAPKAAPPKAAPPQAAEPETAEPQIEIRPDQPVNVTEELGLDPAPVEKPRKKPVTKIDAAADPSEVDVTPADVAKVVAKDDPA